MANGSGPPAQVGAHATMPSGVMRRAVPFPVAFITYIAMSPSRSDVNAISAPFGDHAGS